jgi:hypothetical protein
MLQQPMSPFLDDPPPLPETKKNDHFHYEIERQKLATQ